MTARTYLLAAGLLAISCQTSAPQGQYYQKCPISSGIIGAYRYEINDFYHNGTHFRQFSMQAQNSDVVPQRIIATDMEDRETLLITPQMGSVACTTGSTGPPCPQELRSRADAFLSYVKQSVKNDLK